MTDRYELRDICAAILKGATDAGPRVYTPGDWPTWDQAYPVIRISAPRERKESQGRGGSALFTVVSTIRVVVTVAAPADALTWGEMDAEAALQPLEARILQLLVNNPELRRRTSQFPEISSQIAVSPEGLENLAELLVDIDMEFAQGPDQFWNPGALPLTAVAVGWNQDPSADAPAGPSPDIGLYVALPPDP